MTLDDRIPDILSRVDLDALVVRLGGVESGRPGTYHCPMPAHEDRTPSFTVKEGRWRCWSVCAAGGDAIDLLVWLQAVTKAEAIDELASSLGIGNAANAAADSSPADLVRRWCGAHGWGPWVVEELELTVVYDRFSRPRVRFPFRCGGQVPYHQDRLLVDSDTRYKYLAPKGAKPIPYEADRMALARERGHVFVLEGVTDVVALVDTYTSPAVVGIPGVAVWQADWARAFTGLDVYVVADNDDAGEGFRGRLGRDLGSVARSVTQVYVPPAHNDVAAWRHGLDPEDFDAQLMAAVQESAGHGVRIA